MKAMMDLNPGIILEKNFVDDKIKDLIGIDNQISSLSSNNQGLMIVEQVSPAIKIKPGIHDISDQKKRLITIAMSMVSDSLFLPGHISQIHLVRKIGDNYYHCDIRESRLPDENNMFYFFELGKPDFTKIIRSDEIKEADVMRYEMLETARALLEECDDEFPENEFLEKLCKQMPKDLAEETLHQIKKTGLVVEVKEGVLMRL